MGEGGTSSRRQRGALLRRIGPVIILLTIPCYCIGLAVLEWNRLVVPTTQRVGALLLDWIFTPVGLITVVLVLLILLTEPFHGGVTNAGAAGVQVVAMIDPTGCLILLALLFLLGVGIFVWAG